LVAVVVFEIDRVDGGTDVGDAGAGDAASYEWCAVFDGVGCDGEFRGADPDDHVREERR